jgi:stage II sporulation protein GA (sporulation sigma-E factor processing peptidase)
MKIYLDVLVITNSVVTLIYLWCICRITHDKITPKREIAACAVGGAASLLVMAQSESFVGAFFITAAKFAAVGIIIFAAFSPKSLSEFVKFYFLYGALELIFGGLCFMYINLAQSRIIYIKNYTVYFDVSLLEIGACCACFYLITAVWEHIRLKNSGAQRKFRASFAEGKYEITLPAIADTGNMLCDSFTGAPVVIFCSDELYERYELSRPEQTALYGFRPIPYSTISGDGLIYITSKGSVTISCRDFTKSVNCCVGVVPSSGGTHAIFNPEILV